MVWTCVGLALFVAVLLVVRDHRALARYAYTLAAAGLVFLALPALLPGRFSEVNGAKIWIRVAGFSIQPGEFAKLALMVFFAAYLVQKRDVLSLASRRVAGIDLPRGRDLGPVLVAWGLSLLVLVGEKDLGTSLLFFGIFVVMIYIATERTSWLLIGVGLFMVGAVIAYQLFAHVQERVHVWLRPFDYRDRPGLPDRAVAVRPRHRRPVRHRAGRWPAGDRAVREDRLHHRHRRRGARPVRPGRAAGALRRSWSPAASGRR